VTEKQSSAGLKTRATFDNISAESGPPVLGRIVVSRNLHRQECLCY